MNARYHLVCMAAVLFLIAPASQAGEPATRAPVGSSVDCESLKHMDYSTMDLYAVRAMERECAEKARVVHAAACGCEGCTHLAQHHPRDEHEH